MTYAGDITPEQAWSILRDDPTSVLVDVRTTAEWQFVGLPDPSELGKQTVLVEWSTFPSGDLNQSFVDQLRDAGVDDERTVLFICRSGQRSIGAAEAATAAGLGPAYNILDGFEGALGPDGHRGAVGWRAVGLPWRQS